MNSSENYASLLNVLPLGILTLDSEFTITYANNDFFGEPETINGQTIFSLVADEYHGALKDILGWVKKQQALAQFEYSNEQHDAWYECRITPDKHQQDTNAYLFIATDITERHLLDQKQNYDALTGMPNRNLFLNQVMQSMEEQQKDKEKNFAILWIDVDGFQLINESFSFEISNEFLIEMSTRLSFQLPDNCFSSHISENEFAVLIEEMEMDQLETLIQGIQNDLAEPFFMEAFEIYSGVNVGVVVLDTDYKTADDVLRDAVTALGQAHRKGKYGYQIFEASLHDEAMRYLKVGAELKQAIENDQMVVYYQPLVDLKERKVHGMEALVRWEHPEKGLIMPNSFIPLTEENDLILPIGQFVLDSVCEQLRVWYDAGFDELFVAINFSANQFGRQDPVGMIKTALETHGLPASCLKLEVTESQMIDDIPQTISIMNQLKELGIEISIDDFGTGYSSFAYLKQFPVHTLKIDVDFVKDLPDDKSTAGIIKGIIDMAHNLGLKVVAEGIETMGQKLFLRNNNCDMGQGYLFGRALPSEHILPMLQEMYKNN
jgi:diguanylate cyclase (GGDEF)-like protein/PAS domain S-box-containing protein